MVDLARSFGYPVARGLGLLPEETLGGEWGEHKSESWARKPPQFVSILCLFFKYKTICGILT